MAFSGLVAKLRSNGVDHSLIVASINLAFSVVLFLARIGLSVYYFVNDNKQLKKERSGKEKLIKQ